MGEFLITCVTTDRYGDLTHVGLSSGKYITVGSVIYYIDNNIHNFYTNVYNERAEVYAKSTPEGSRFITTNRDGILPNNLDNLPRCQYYG
jgi:hypothetical protein